MTAVLTGGFSDPPLQSAQSFRALLETMARPGQIQRVTGARPPAPLSVAAGVTLLTLCDATTPLHLAGQFDCAELRGWIAFHCGAPLVSAQKAQFALGLWPDLQPVDRFSIGDPAYPDRAATLIVERAELVASGARLRGPGIETEASLSLPEIAAFQENQRLFPLGFDVIFTCGQDLAALPRSTKVEIS